jgi:hypothetical protein
LSCSVLLVLTKALWDSPFSKTLSVFWFCDSVLSLCLS